MARITIDEPIYIGPDEFLEKCSTRELKETYELLITNYDMESKDNGSVRSEGHRQFLYHLDSLKNSWYSVCNEDAKIIEILAKKYGAV